MKRSLDLNDEYLSTKEKCEKHLTASVMLAYNARNFISRLGRRKEYQKAREHLIMAENAVSNFIQGLGPNNRLWDIYEPLILILFEQIDYDKKRIGGLEQEFII